MLEHSEDIVSISPKETVKAGLETLGLTDENDTSLSSFDLISSSSVKIKYFSPKWRVLMQYIMKCIGGMQGSHDQPNANQEAYNNENLKTLKPHHITSLSFKPTLKNETALTAHICKVADLSPVPITSLLPPSGEPKKKRILPSFKPKSSKQVMDVPQKKQVAKTQHAEETIATADATQSLRASESAEDQVNQPKTVDAEKVQETIAEKVKLIDKPEDQDTGIDYGLCLATKESPYDTESEIKVIKRFQPTQMDDDDQIILLGAEHDDMDQRIYGGSG
ncbi:hypothetical protein Tco_1472499 [Tanacetum coccineum]